MPSYGAYRGGGSELCGNSMVAIDTGASFADDKVATAADLILPAEPYRILPILLGAGEYRFFFNARRFGTKKGSKYMAALSWEIETC